MAPAEDAPTLLKRAHLRVTASRLATLDAIAKHPHSDADTIARAVRSQLGSVSTQAIYDSLNTFARTGLIRRIDPAGHPARFECRTGDNHHHLVCRQCGHVVDVDCAVNYTPCLTPSDSAGFDVDEAEVTYWGLCPTCRK